MGILPILASIPPIGLIKEEAIPPNSRGLHLSRGRVHAASKGAQTPCHIVFSKINILSRGVELQERFLYDCI